METRVPLTSTMSKRTSSPYPGSGVASPSESAEAGGSDPSGGRRHLLATLGEAIEAIEAGQTLDRIEARLRHREHLHRHLEAEGTDAEMAWSSADGETSVAPDAVQIATRGDGVRPSRGEVSDRRPTPFHRDRSGSACWNRLDSGIHELFPCVTDDSGAAQMDSSVPSKGHGPSSTVRDRIWLPPVGAAIGWLWRLIDGAAHADVDSGSRHEPTCRSGRILWLGSNVFPHTRSLVGGLRGHPTRPPDARLLDRSWFVEVPDSHDGSRRSNRLGRRDRSAAPRAHLAHRTWILEQAIRCPGVAAAVADAEGLSMACTRRLHLAVRQAESQGRRVLVLLLRPPWDRGEISAAASRWSVSPTGRAAPAMRSGDISTILGTRSSPPEEPVAVAWRMQLLHRKGGVGARAPASASASVASQAKGRHPNGIAHDIEETFTTLRMDEWECRDGCDTANPGTGASGVVGGARHAEASGRRCRSRRALGSRSDSPAFSERPARAPRRAAGSAARLPSLHDSHARPGDRTATRDGDELRTVAAGSPRDSGCRSGERAGARRADRRGPTDRQAMLFEMSEAGGATGIGAVRSPDAAR